MEIRIEGGDAAPGMPAILIDGNEVGRLARAGAALRARMTRWRAYDGENFDDIAGARAFFEREFADAASVDRPPGNEQTEIAVTLRAAQPGEPAEWVMTADGVEIGRLVPEGDTARLTARMSRWKAYDGTSFAHPDAARAYFDTEFNGTGTEGPRT